MSDRHPFEAIVDVAQALGIANLAQTHEGRCWEHHVDAAWWFAVNPNPREVKATDGTPVPRFSAVIKFNGWPASVFGFGDQEFVFAMGEAANVDTLIEACERAAKAVARG